MFFLRKKSNGGALSAAIFGLGNPGEKYAKTRHNAGFMAVDFLADKYGISITKKLRGLALYGRGKISEKNVFLIKPLTYMNLSGEAAREFLRFFHMDISAAIVVFDNCDINAGLARFKLRGAGNTAHNGIKNIAEVLKTHDFRRVAIGTGPKPKEISLTDFCLTKPESADEQNALSEGVKQAAEIIERVL